MAALQRKVSSTVIQVPTRRGRTNATCFELDFTYPMCRAHILPELIRAWFKVVNMAGESDRLHVLVVDDNIDAAASLCSLLQHLECETETATEIHSALTTAAEFKPDLVILDLEMPGADGCQVLKEMKEMPGGPKDALYVCLTGSNPEENRSRCQEAGFDRFFSKPIWMQELTQILEEGHARLLQTKHILSRPSPVRRAGT